MKDKIILVAESAVCLLLPKVSASDFFAPIDHMDCFFHHPLPFKMVIYDEKMSL